MSLDPTLVNFRILFPEFDSADDARVELFLQCAIDVMSTDACYGMATMYRAAHELSLNTQQSSGSDNVQGAGALTSASADGLSVGFANPEWAFDANGSYWSKTPYGQKYMQLIQECSNGSRVTGGCGGYYSGYGGCGC